MKPVRQSELGDCHFLPSLILLAKQPGLIPAIFIEPFENDTWSIGVNFYQMGERKSIIGDSRFLFKNHKPRLVRSVLGIELW
jgi:hypothetical protein